MEPVNNVVETVPDQNQNIQQQTPVDNANPTDGQDVNWRKFREQRDFERKQAEELSRKAIEKEREVEALKAALEAVVNKPSQQTQSNSYGYEEETEDQRIEKKVQVAMAQKEAELSRQREQEELRTYPQKLIQNHPDFEQVCHANNLDYLEYHYPEVATPFKYMPDGYEKWNAIYKAVKKLVPSTDTRKDEAKAEKNLSRPQSISSTGMAHGGNAMPAARLDEARKRENWDRMKKTLKAIG